VRWWRLPGYCLAYIFQLLTRRLSSPVHVLACRLYAEAQANLGDDLAHHSLENAYLAVRTLGEAGWSGLEGVEGDLEARLKSHYCFFYGLSRPESYAEANPLACHLYQVMTAQNFQTAFPGLGNPARQSGPAGLEGVIEQSAGVETLYYRVLARRFLGMFHQDRGDNASAVAQFERAIAEAEAAHLETEIGHLYRFAGDALSRAGRRQEAVERFEQACRYETLPHFAYWFALSARELGDARLRQAGAELTRPVMERAFTAYRAGRMAFDQAAHSPVPVARVAKQQLFRSFHENALQVAMLLGHPPDVLAELEAGGPRQATEVVAEIEACRAAVPDAVRSFRQGRARLYAGLGSVPGDFRQYLKELPEANASRQNYIQAYVKLEKQIKAAQLSDQAAERVLALRLPGVAFLLFNIGWESASVALFDAEKGQLMAAAKAPFGYPDLVAVHQRFRQGVAQAEQSFARREALFRAALDGLLAEYQGLFGELLEGFLPAFSGRHLVIFPRAQLHAVPFHALNAGGRYLMESCVVSYCQTLGLFLEIRERAEGGSAGVGLLTVYRDKDLPFYSGMLAGLGSGHVVLRNPTLKAVQEAAARERPADVLFACHGSYVPGDPRPEHPILRRGRILRENL
jgi:hypothetical protein